ncbi:FHIPEP family type III secretion protein [Geodermatophilus siccatus]|uniref:FHIPEP family type III secretion protein n=1 Tax=Geodermatophilus siccatus TaxID=1137991 RepID=UPI0011144A08|nr:FHIPEP family type III secretion protein [Geodermatophilus siccatus]
MSRAVTDDLAAVSIGPLALAARGWLAWQLRRASSYDQAGDVLRTLEDELSAMAGRLRAQRSRLDALRESRVLTDPAGPAWRDDVRTRLSGTPRADRAAVWRNFYAAAFCASQFEACLWLCDADGVRPDDDTRRQLRGSAEAARHGLLAYTLPGLELLTDPACSAAIDDDVRGRCWVMRARAVCRGLNEPGAAVELLGSLTGASQPWSSTVRAVVHVALGEALLDHGDPAAAQDELHRALLASEAEPSAHVLGGMIAEAAGEVARAEQWYDAALALDAERVVSGALFAPVPPILLWRHGRRLRSSDTERAVTAIRRALQEAQALPAGAFPERKAYVDLARTHDRAGNRTEAGRAYAKAAQRYAAKGDRSTAREYIGLAVERQPAEVEYRFLYAEALRLEAVRQDGLVDLVRLAEAAQHWSEGMVRAADGGQPPWVYATGASIAHLRSGDLYRPRASTSATAVLERGLLVAPADRQLTGPLSQAHRLIGNPWAALDLSRQGLERDPGNEVLFDQHLLALLELERPQEALELVTARPMSRRTPWLINRTVQILIELGRPGEAVEVLERHSTGDDVMHALQVGLCHWLDGRPEDASRAYALAADRADAEGQRRDNLRAWALHLLGRHDEAVDVYEPLLTADRRDPSLHWEYGQMLLARGRTGDLEQGARELDDGIRMARSRYALSVLVRMDLPRLLQLTEHAPHADRLRAEVNRVRTTVAGLVEDLRGAGNAVEELERCLDLPAHPADDDDGADRRRACLAGLARLEAADDRTRALRRYLRLGADPAVPEASLGTRRVVRDVWAEIEATARQATPDEGLTAAEALLSLLSGAPGVPPDVLTTTRLRAALLAARAARQQRFAEHLTAALAEPAPGASAAVASTLAEAVDTFATYWVVRDAAQEMGRSVAAGSPECEAVRRLLDALPLAGLLRTRREDVDPRRMYPLLTPLAIRVGAALWPKNDPDRTSAWRSAVTELRGRIQDEVGVLLPHVGLGLDPDLADDAYRVELYDDVRVRGTVQVTADQDSAQWAAAVDTVVARLEEVARGTLNRLFTIDDVALWLGGGAFPEASRQALARTSRSERLELLRLLRLLLREQVPIVDRDTILAEVARHEPHWSAPAALPAVRRRLLAADRASIVDGVPSATLPVDLEQRLRAGLDPEDPSVWQLPREEATTLAAALAAWHEDAGHPRCVSMGSAELRPYVWRLLAMTSDHPVRVLSKEEIGVRT